MKGKKVLALALALLMVMVNVVGCGKKDDPSEEVSSPPSSSSPSAPLPEVKQEEKPAIDIPQNKPPELPNLPIEQPADDGIGEPGVDFELLETGPADDWGSEAVPGYNPLGSKALYISVSYTAEAKPFTFTVLDGYTPKSIEVTGPSWELRFPETSLSYMKYRARELGGTVYPSAGDRAIFYIPDGSNGYWCIGRTESDGHVCTVVQIKTVLPGQPMTVDASGSGGEQIFYTDCTPGKLQTAHISLSGGKATLTAAQESTIGDTVQSVSRRWELDAEKSKTYILDDIPIVDGQLVWSLVWSSDPPQDFSFSISDTADIGKVAWGEDFGAIKVSGVPMGSVQIWPQQGLRFTDNATGYTAQGGYPLKVEGVIQPDGSTLTALPAGYYEVRFGDGLSIEAQGAQQLVPVSSGQVTEIEIPKELMVTYQNLSNLYANFETSEGSLQVLSVTEDGGKAVAEVLLNDPLRRDILPKPEEVSITENGAAAKVISVERAEAQADVVLVLDTSGSMASDMQAAVDAAKRFVESLPDGTNIQLVQFAQQITQHQGVGKEAVIKALDSVKAVGGTALYDATSKALGLVKEKERPYVVVFSDGADSRELVNMGKGSDLNREQIIAAIGESGVTMLTIGFGAGHDPGILIEMSGASEGGGYFAAADQSALDSAFASVAGQFGNQYTVTYERPTVSGGNSQTPVVAFAVDASGSMHQPSSEDGSEAEPAEEPASDGEEAPAENDANAAEALAGQGAPDPVITDRGYRLDTAKALLHDAILALPEDTLMQFGSFKSDGGMVYAPYGQITTSEKAGVLKALGSLQPGGDTEGLEDDEKTIRLTATLRDFKDGGPIFGVWNGGKGYVDKTLGTDRKPVFLTEKWEKDGVKDTSLLDYCFRDKPGYNMSMQYDLELESDEAGNFKVDFSSWNQELAETMPYPPGFFPIDNMLFGNEGSVHNYLFSCEIHTAFTYYEGATFSFTGDDDVWVYIDNTLVVDLGGVHSAEDANISLDELVANGTLDITPGEVVNFDFFFMERMPSESNMMIQTNFDFVIETEGSRISAKGTPLLQGVQTAAAILEPVPSDKRTMVIVTDGALDMGGIATEQKQLDEQLAKIKAAGYNVLLVGVGDETYAKKMDPLFAETAKKAGGDYIITDDAAKLSQKLKTVAAKTNTPAVGADVSTTVTVGFDCNAADGSRAAFYTSQDIEGLAPASGSGGGTSQPAMVKLSAGGEYRPYSPKTAQLLTGGDAPKAETIVSLHMPLKAAGSNTEKLTDTGVWAENELVRFTVTDAYFMDVFKGISAPSGKQFLAVDTLIQWNNQTETDYEAYQVPTILNHFYASVNGGMAQASEATWLAESPLTVPGNPQLEIPRDTAVSGALVFVVDRDDGEEVSQFALHFYDIVHGHATIPVCGSAPQYLTEITELPTAEPAKISEAFELTISGSADESSVGGVAVAESEASPTQFRVAEGRFDSKVQALLNLDPQQRFLFAVDTDQGPLAVKMSDVVYSMPMGFTGSAYLAPGSQTAVRMPFEVPEAMAKASSHIYADLSSGTVELPVTSGSPYKTGSLGKTFSHEYFDLTINGFYPVKEGSDLLVVDFTLKDKKDGFGTGGIASLFSVTNRGEMDEKTAAAVLLSGRGSAVTDGELNNNLYRSPDVQTTLQYLYGAVEESADWGVLDNYTRRGLLFFDGSSMGERYLTSAFFEDMSIPLAKTAYPYPALLAKKTPVTRDLSFEQALSEAVSAAISEYETTRSAAPNITVMEPEGGKIVNTPSPSFTLYGSRLLESVKTEKDLMNLLYGLALKVNNSYDDELNHYLYAPESTLTQGWGSQYDLAMLAMDGLSRLGFEPKLRTLRLSSDGREGVRQMAVACYDSPEYMPGVQYTDESGNDRLLAIPFMRELSEISGICYLPYEEPAMTISPMTTTLTVTVNAEVTDTQATGQMQLFGDMFGALAGEPEEGVEPEPVYETVLLLEQELSLPDIGRDVVDLSFLEAAKSDKNGESVVIAALETREGLLSEPDKYIDLGVYRADSVTVSLLVEDVWGNVTEDYASTTHPLPKEQKLIEVMQSFAIALPEISEAAAKELSAAISANAGGEEKSSNYSISRWMGHAALHRLITGLGDYDQENAGRLQVQTGRVTEPLVLGVTMRSDGKEAKMFVDLMHHDNQVINWEDGSARDGYMAGLGMAASQLEASAIPGGGIGYLDVWTALPKDAQILPYYTDHVEDAEALATKLEAEGYPTVLAENIRKQYGSTVFVVPSSPATVQGESHWAWLEIDTDTYSTVSVFETGERSGLAGFVLGLVPKNLAEPAAGALVGISTSIGSIAAYTLEGDDYGEVLVQSKALCQYISGLMKAVTGAKDIAENLNDLKNTVDELDGFTGDNFQPAMDKLMEYLANLDYNAAVSATGVIPSGFVDGFDKAVECYFDGVPG